MLDPDIKIVNVAEDTRFDRDNGSRFAIIRVTYRVGDHGPFVERFEKDTYSMEVRDAKLNAFAGEVRAS